MKFGETLYRRSVPKWAAYNVNYNQLKHLIKVRTSSGSALPVSIPSASVSRWHDLEKELYNVIKQEYENVGLFLRSKQGEIERRLSHLEKQVQSSKKAVDNGTLDRPILQARKYQRLVKDADSIGDEVENISRFTAVQKTAFRKILKKYRKWTDSTALQRRLEAEVFSSGALQVGYANYLQRLSIQSHIISSQLAGPMLSGPRSQRTDRRKSDAGEAINRSNAKAIAETCSAGVLHFDAALSWVAYGEAGGSAHFWIHPDNLEEAEALLLRHLRLLEPQSPPPAAMNGATHSRRQNNIAFADNVERFTQDTSLARPSTMALAARWSAAPEALVTFSSLVPKTTNIETAKIRRKDLSGLLQRSLDPRPGKPFKKVQDYLSEHRDVKPLAEVRTVRTRYIGINNASEIGSWATLDSSVLVSPADIEHLGDLEWEPPAAEAFPHSILHIRWEFSRMPEIVRMLQTSHLAEAVSDFSLGRMAIYTVFKDLEQPGWRKLLETDIRKVPSTVRRKASARDKANHLSAIPVSSGPSSTDGPSDSVFSTAPGQSSATSNEHSPVISQREQSFSESHKTTIPPPETARSVKKKRARIASPARRATPSQRYWNEFDDGDSDVHVEDSYAIYVDPNEPSFPGAETVSKVFGTMYDSLSKGSQRMISWLPIRAKHDEPSAGERTPLLFDGQGSTDGDPESSGSETDEFLTRPHKHHRRRSIFQNPGPLPWNSRGKFRAGQPLSRRQRALETTLFQFYTGLIALAYLLLIMAGILFSAGRKKKLLEVDAGIVAGVVAAEACAGISIILICMRRKPLGPVHWGLVAANVTSIVVIGVAELAVMFMGRA